MPRLPDSRLLRVLTLGMLTLCASPLAAWRPETQEALALDAARLAPPDLARQIERHRRAYLQGVRGPLTDSAAAFHMKNADGSGELDEAIAAEIAQSIAAIRKHRPFADIVERLGRISHFVADANLPLNTANGDRDERRYFRDYLDYAESARSRFAVVFYGVGGDWRSGGDLDAWTRRTLARGRKLYPSIGDEYRRIGLTSGIGRFDDRSTAYAVAALSYSHGVSDVVRAFRYVWITAGGGDSRARLEREPDRVYVIRPGGRR